MSGSPRAVLEVSPGEVLDRITILAVKRTRLAAGASKSEVEGALASAIGAWADVVARTPAVDTTVAAQLERDLQALNDRLWRAEDRIRAHERCQDWGMAFVEVAREICRLNDARADLKNEVDALFGLGAQRKIYE
jgi:hypothetical protein